jgi:hypothetical protein
MEYVAFADAAKLRFQMRQQSNVAQVSNEKAQTTAASQGVVGHFNTINNIVVFCIWCVIIAHYSSHPSGLQFGTVVLGRTTAINHNLLPFGWDFFMKNRSNWVLYKLHIL